MAFRLLYFNLLLFVFIFQSKLRAENILSYSYLNYPPYLTSLVDPHMPGLTRFVVNYLNLQAQEHKKEYNFKLEVVPGKRIETKLKTKKENFIILWLQPSTYPEITDAKNWTRPLQYDKSVVISPEKKPFEYKNPSDFNGKTFAAIVGHRYPFMSKDLEVNRQDIANADNLALYIEAGRADLGIMPYSSLIYMSNYKKYKIHVAKKPFHENKKCIVVFGEDEFIKFVQNAVDSLVKSPLWKKTLNEYHLKEEFIENTVH